MLIESDSHGKLMTSQFEKNNQAVYSQYFGFSQKPFSCLPNKKYFHPYKSAIEMINTVTFSIHSGEAIVKVTGVSGVGKTYLLRRVLSSLGGDYYTISIASPNLSALSLLKSLVEELGAIYPQHANETQLLKLIQLLLFEHYTKTDCRIVLWIDDVHRLSDDTLNTIVALSKLETNYRSLLQFVLSGTEEFNAILRRATLIQLRERITFSADLHGLNKREIKDYLLVRLEMVEANHLEYFSATAISTLFAKTGGVARKINRLSHKALLLAYGKGDGSVKRRHILMAAKDDELTHGISSHKSQAKYGLMALFGFIGVIFLISRSWLDL